MTHANAFPGLGVRIRQRLKVLGYWNPRHGRPDLQRFLKEHHGYRYQYLHAWVYRDRVPERPRLERLAKDLDVTPWWLLFGEAVEMRPRRRRR